VKRSQRGVKRSQRGGDVTAMWQRLTAASLSAVVGVEGHAAPAEEKPVEPIELVGLQNVAILVLGRGSERCEVGRGGR
jgi:hypothetical protein